MYCPGYRPRPLVKAVGNDESIFIYNNETLFEHSSFFPHGFSP